MTDAESLRELDLLDPRRWLAHGREAPHVGPILRGLPAPQAFRQYPIHSRIARLPASAAWTAAGDAAACFDPISSLGIGHALSSGMQAARVAHSHIEQAGGLGEAYRQSLLDHFESYVKTRHGFYASEQRWPGPGFWSRRLANVTAPRPSLAATSGQQW
jgi:2-polyprenyl-6-methoxyphenol hydroxylase-like FAD-dependent oxidoreductase